MNINHINLGTGEEYLKNWLLTFQTNRYSNEKLPQGKPTYKLSDVAGGGREGFENAFYEELFFKTHSINQFCTFFLSTLKL